MAIDCGVTPVFMFIAASMSAARGSIASVASFRTLVGRLSLTMDIMWRSFTLAGDACGCAVSSCGFCRALKGGV